MTSENFEMSGSKCKKKAFFLFVMKIQSDEIIQTKGKLERGCPGCNPGSQATLPTPIPSGQ